MGDRPNAITWHLAIPAETTSWSGERGVAFFEYLMCERLPGELPLPAESMRILVSVVTKLRRVTIDNSYLPSE